MKQPAIGPINLSGHSPLVNALGIQAAVGTNHRATPATWLPNSNWIWRNDRGSKPTVTRFRKTFTLTHSPKGGQIFASADVRYRLWVNGRLVARGPADTGRDYDTGAPGPWFDDARDISLFLHVGENVIAAEVFPESLVSSEGTTGHPGFKVALNIENSDGTRTRLFTDETWKSSIAGDLAQHNGPNGFRVDASLEPVGWQNLSYNDSGWDRSVITTDQRKANLLSELAPPLEAVVPSSGTTRVTPGVHVLDNNGSATFTQDGGYAVRYPRILSAYIALRVNGTKGGRLLIMPNEADAPGFNRRAEILLRDGEQTIEIPYFDSFSTINIEAKDVTNPITIQEVQAIFTSYPVRYLGAFECDRPELNRIWAVCRWVTQICMQTHHLDSPHHQEPISDPGDYLIEALNSYHAFGESALARQDLRKYARTLKQREYQSFHTSYSLLWLQMLTQYYEYTGDADLVRELAPDVHHLVDRFESYVGPNGLISNAPNYMFMDWVEIGGFNAHHPPAVVGQGYMTALFYRALEDDRRVAELEGDTTRSAHDENLRERIRAAFDRELWSDTEGLYRDGKPHQSQVKPNEWLPADTDIETFSTQVNTLAVTCGLTDHGRSQSVMRKILSRPDMNCQPYFMHFVFEALSDSGLFNELALAQLERWHILTDSQSFLEMWNTGDRSHAWNATPMFQMSGRMLGVRPTKPGFKRFELRPQTAGLNWAKGNVPTPHGDIHVEWRVQGAHLSVSVEVPEGTVAECDGHQYPPGRHQLTLAIPSP